MASDVSPGMPGQQTPPTAGSPEPTGSRWLPPFAPVAVAFAVVVMLLHVVVPAVGFLIGLVIASPFVIAGDVVVVAVAAVGGWYWRRAASGTRRGRVLEAWETEFATTPVAAVCFVLAVAVALAFPILGLSWLGVAVAGVFAGYVAQRLTDIRPTPPSVTVIPDAEQPSDLEAFQRTELKWSLDPELPGASGAVSLWIKSATVDEFRAANPGVVWDGSLPRLDWYVTEGRCDEINTLADRLVAVAGQRSLTRYFEMMLALDLVQKIPYATDTDSKQVPEYWRFPLETIADGCGDCEDFAILAVALLSAMGHRTCFFEIPGHTAVGVADIPSDTGVSFEAADGQRFHFVETTTDGWRVGELPEGIAKDSVKVAHIVQPQHARQPERVIPEAPDGQWREDSQILTRASLLLAAFGGTLGAALWWITSR